MDVFKQEQRYLSMTLEQLESELIRIDRDFQEGIQAGNEDAAESIRKLLERRYRQLLLVRGKPYFARVDFRETMPQPAITPQKLYLGKTSVFDENANSIVTDWRAPVASIYYDYRLGEASYRSLEGTVHGELMLKRQFEVEDGALQGYSDVDIISDDELLQPYLSVSSDARLKNIIATIQSEQNQIIRADMHTPMIVQGAAGSGKTTVALHRVAYLVYTYEGKFKPEHFLIIAPSSLFLRYISQILPDLGVENVPQQSYEELVRRVTGLKFKMAEDTELGDGQKRWAAYKSSIQMRSDLDMFLDTCPMFPQEGFRIGQTEVLSREDILQYLAGYPQLAYYERLNRLKERLLSLTEEYEGGRQAVKAYIRQAPRISVMELYDTFWAQKTDEPDARRSKGRLSYEDLTPLLYLYHRIFGAKDKQVRHVIIDEAQDCSLFQLALLQELYPNAAFTIFGDLAQSIYSYRGISNWQTVSETVWKSKARVAALQKSYRTTIEISNEANRVLDCLPDIPKGEAVIRHGDPVFFEQADGMKSAAQSVIRRIAHHKSAGHDNIALIGKDLQSCKALEKYLPKEIEYNSVSEHSGDYQGGVSLVPVAMSKGLEFDAVIVFDGERYTRSREDAHLCYVALTRAMHALDVIYQGEWAYK